jgi:UDP-2,3-diacylglucosamine pyrophosphatase LpxH
MPELNEDTLVVFVSDSHIGGDPGCDGFESPEELSALLDELAGRDGPVELILAGDFFDFLQISPSRDGLDRAALTMARPEYEGLFAALGRFASGEHKRVVYLPGNHDAEMWWNPRIQETLRKRGLVDEFAFSYEARFEVGGEQRIVYCEHGNQFDPANTVEDYGDPLDTPLGHHVVTDFTRRVAPFGEVSRGLNLSEIKNVYPLVEIPRWVASRYRIPALAAACVLRSLPHGCLPAGVHGRASRTLLSELPGAAPRARFLSGHRSLRARDAAYLRDLLSRGSTRGAARLERGEP